MTEYLTYWQNSTADWHVGQVLDHIAGAQFGSTVAGDVFWVVTYRDDSLFLVGRLVSALGPISQHEAERRLRRTNVYKARYHILATKASVEPADLADITHLIPTLRFIGRTPKLPRELTAQSFRRMRQLDYLSAAALRAVRSLAYPISAVKLGDEGDSEARTSSRNPAWVRDELILALDVYLSHRPQWPAAAEVRALSAVLKALPIHPQRAKWPTFRNANGVNMKLANFAAIDPDHSAEGLRRGGRLEQLVWDEYAHRPAELRATAEAIRRATSTPAVDGILGSEVDDEASAPEGRVLFRLHRYRERDSKLARRKKEAALKRQGFLRCEVCAFDFSARYGQHGYGFIECHHTTPLSQLEPGATTTLRQLALVCSNCHRMLHYRGATLPLAQLRLMLQ